MFTSLLGTQTPTSEPENKEGDLYKVITAYGKTFELRYGYYEECDRLSPLCDPVVIYPDFLKEPIYTDDGTPFVTMVQDACKSYKGETKRNSNTTCADCKYFKHGEDWIGLCTCIKNNRNQHQ